MQRLLLVGKAAINFVTILNLMIDSKNRELDVNKLDEMNNESLKKSYLEERV